MSRDGRVTLKRTLGLWALIAYGLGDILGAGIYALVGKIAGMAGLWGWASFGTAMVVASFTGLAYAELVARYPRSGGESYFCERAFHRPSMSLLTGWLVFCSGVVSLATVSHAFAGYVKDLVPLLPNWTVLPVFLLGLGGINFWGIRQSSTANIICTVVEVSGLLIVLIVGFLVFSNTPPADPPPAASNQSSSWAAIMQGAALAFFAFIGFEDMVNVAEEVKLPARHFPIAIIVVIIATGTIYMLVSYTATAVVSPGTLSESDAPLLDVVRQAHQGFPGWLFRIIALFAVTNTGLLNFVMASRLIYGMSTQGVLPRWLSAVHPHRRTPHRAVLVVFVFASLLAFSGTLTYLAGTTSILILIVFAVINVALLIIKKKQHAPESGFRVPRPVPVIGALLCCGLTLFVQWSSLSAAGVLVLIGLGLVAWNSRSRSTSRNGQ